MPEFPLVAEGDVTDDLLERVNKILESIVVPHDRIVLGLSGGVDSVVLLHLLHRLASHYSWHLTALHVHHGISCHADEWADFCSELCKSYNIPLQIIRVDITPLREQGTEAAARQLRHAALDRQEAEFIALAHHLDDQAETLLLQLLRGAGLRGVSAMPIIRNRAAYPTQLRPLLHSARSELLVYAQQHDLRWVEDESNAEDIYQRNFLRSRIFPLLEQRFPAYRKTLGRSARHFAEASELLDDLAQQDGGKASGEENGLEIALLQALSPSRAKNLLRHFLYARGVLMPHAVQLDEMLRQLCEARQDAVIRLDCGRWQLGRYRGKAYVFPSLPQGFDEICVQWTGETVLKLPQLGGTLYFETRRGQGLSLKKLQQREEQENYFLPGGDVANPVTVRVRRGAERIRLEATRPLRTLKNLLQEHDIPPWQRNRMPLLFCGEVLVGIPGIGYACEYQAAADELGIMANWFAMDQGLGIAEERNPDSKYIISI